MLCEAANPLGIQVVILDAENSPAKQVNAKTSHIDGSFIDEDKILELAREVDILMVEIEHVNTHILEKIATEGVEITGQDGKRKTKKVEVQPSRRTIRTIQDKFLQKKHFISNGVSTVPSKEVESNLDALHAIGQEYGYPFMLKAYDGRGQCRRTNETLANSY